MKAVSESVFKKSIYHQETCMRKIPNRMNLTAPATALAVSALLAACGGGSASAPADTTPPTVAVTDNVSAPTASGNVTFTFTFNEAVTGFTESDVTVTNGTKGTFTMANDRLSATLVVIPNTNTAATMTVAVAINAFTDTSGNGNTATASGSQAYDTQVNALTFASGYTAIDASTVGYAYQGLSTQGGAFNWTVADGGTYDWGGADFWWSGVASNDATPNFYWGGKGKSNQDYMESWVNAPSNGTLTLSGQTQLRISVWGNDELVGAPRFTPVVQLANNGGCYARAEAPALTPASTGVATYNIALSDFSVVENCGTPMTAAQFFANGIGSVRVRIYKTNYYNPGNTYSSANGINLGPISFQP
jgi:Bacterial Ig-like domain